MTNIPDLKWRVWLPGMLLMVLTLALRAHNIRGRGYTVDELWAAEVASGRGSNHLTLQRDIVLTAPDLMGLASAPPWWKVWGNIQSTHPPLYLMLLRLWEETFGDNDVSARWLSVLASVVAVGVLYDAVRLLNGKSEAIWAGLLMALAQPQIDYGRQARNYAMLMAVGLLALDAVVRVEVLGMNRRRWSMVLFATLATALTHYFAAGALIALGLYVLIRFRGRTRINTMLALVIAAAIFAVIWGPFMWEERMFFSTMDQNTLFLRNSGPGHVLGTLYQFVLLPARFLAEPRPAMAVFSCVSALLYVLPFLLLRRQSGLLIWSLWLLGIVVPITAMDLTRKTNQLLYIRYTLLAGPAVYVLIPAVFSAVRHRQWMWQAVPAAAVLSCALAVTDSYRSYETDSRLIAAELGPRLGPNDLVVFVSTDDRQWTGGAQYLMLSRYLRPIPCAIAFLNQPATGEVLARARASRYVYVFSSESPADRYIPGARVVDGRMYLFRGMWLQLDASKKIAASRHG